MRRDDMLVKIVKQRYILLRGTRPAALYTDKFLTADPQTAGGSKQHPYQNEFAG